MSQSIDQKLAAEAESLIRSFIDRFQNGEKPEQVIALLDQEKIDIDSQRKIIEQLNDENFKKWMINREQLRAACMAKERIEYATRKEPDHKSQ